MYVTLINQVDERYKVVIEDVFLDLYTMGEVKAMLGHEISHVKLNHLSSMERIYNIINDTNFYTFLGGGISAMGLTR